MREQEEDKGEENIGATLIQLWQHFLLFVILIVHRLILYFLFQVTFSETLFGSFCSFVLYSFYFLYVSLSIIYVDK